MNPKQFKKLQMAWYQKLKSSGFDDIEEANGEQLKFWSYKHLTGRKCDPYACDTIIEIQRYYQLAQSLLNGFAFGSARDRKVWTLHCGGLSTRQIASVLGNIDHCTVYQTIKRIRGTILNDENQQIVGDIKIRQGELADVSLIYASWIRPLYYDGLGCNYVDQNDFMAYQKRRITFILSRPSTNVLVACLSDTPDVIVGYSVIEWRKLWWIYVKKAWRDMGIAKKLIPGHVNSCGYLTAKAKDMIPKDWKVSPYFTEELA